MLKIMVVEKLEARRAELVDAICELPGVIARGAAGGFMDALRILCADPLDAVMVGNVAERDLLQLTSLARNLLGCEVIAVADTEELVAKTESLLATRRRADRSIVSRSALALSRANRTALAQHFARPNDPQTIALAEWLPATCARLAAILPMHIELVPVIASGTPPVRCLPEAVEHEMLDIVLEAATNIPWGGTIWLTAELTSDDTVRIDVLENGRGTRDDVTLRTAAPVSS